jgi:hypothetical protein
MVMLRQHPYIYATWIAKLLAGDASCEYLAWFKAHHKIPKRATTLDLARWTADHAELVRRTAAALCAEGYAVTLERQNYLTIASEQGTFVLAGTPDIIAVRDEQTLIVECKTGTSRNADILQTQVYQAMLGRTAAYAGCTIDGRVQYRDEAVEIPAASIDAAFRARLRRLVNAVGNPQALLPAPSAQECRWCDLTAAECLARVEVATPVTTGHGLF